MQDKSWQFAFQGGCHSSYAKLIFQNEGHYQNGVVIPCFKVTKKYQILLVILGSTPNYETSESKKLLVPLSKIFNKWCHFINRILMATSDSIEFRPESFSSKGPGANSGT